MAVNGVRGFRSRPIDRFVGIRIRQRREALRLSLKYIEKRTGIHSEIIERYEASLEKVSPSHLCKMSETLMTSISSFYIDPCRSDNMTVEDSWLDGVLGWRETEKLLHIYYGIKNLSVRLNIMAMMASISGILTKEKVGRSGLKQ